MQQVEFEVIAQKYWPKDKIDKVFSNKKYPLMPSNAPFLLRNLGILNADASISPNNMHKFIQINHMLNLIEPHISELAAKLPQLNILDAGCGKSYLTFLLAWFYQQKSQKHSCDLQILGVDNNKKLIQDCQKKSELLGYNSFLHFDSQSLLNLSWNKSVRPHALVALHACDTATDMALAFAIKQKSDFIAVAPCCQAELARKWKDWKKPEHPLSPVVQSPQLRRETAAQMTDSLRVCLLRANGYEVTCTEFVESNHTPKNRLILATRRGNYLKSAQKEYEDLKNYLGGFPIFLEELLSAEA